MRGRSYEGGGGDLPYYYSDPDLIIYGTPGFPGTGRGARAPWSQAACGWECKRAACGDPEKKVLICSRDDGQ